MPSLGEQQIADLVSAFYGRVRQHPDLAPLFERAITDWDEHLRVIRDFWSHVLLGTNRYRRHAFPAHMGLAIQRQHFDQWMGLFREAAQQTLPPDAAGKAIARAQMVIESFRVGLFPLDPPKPPARSSP